MRVKSGILFLGLIYCNVGAIQAQDTKPDILTNANVIGMVKAGLSSELIVTTINNNGCSFLVDADNLIGLKQARVPDPVLRAMLLKDCKKAGTAMAKAPRDPALGTIQGSLTKVFKNVQIAEAQAIIMLLKGRAEIPEDSYVTMADQTIGVSAPADASCVSAARPSSANPTEDEAFNAVRALAVCGAKVIKNQAAAHTYEILEKTLSDENGRFEITNIAPGEYTLLIKSHTDGLTVRDVLGKMFVMQVKIESGKTFNASHHFGAAEY